MNHLILGGLLSTPAPTAPIVGIAFIVLFAIVGVMVGPDYDGMNAPTVDNSKKVDQNWFFLDQAPYLKTK
jgi:hypothetical protein